MPLSPDRSVLGRRAGWSAAGALAVVLGLWAETVCAQAGAAGDPSTADGPGAIQRPFASSEKSVAIARHTGGGLLELPVAQDYLDGLFRRIKEHRGAGSWPGQTHVLADLGLQAYATDSGDVFVSLGWLVAAQSEDELVGLLAHEFAHVEAWHFTGSNVARSAAPILSALAGLGLGKKDARGTQLSPNAVTTIASDTLQVKLIPAWNRQQESEADRVGAEITAALGYSFVAGPKAFLERVAADEDGRAGAAATGADARQRKTTTPQSASDVVSRMTANTHAPASARLAALTQLARDNPSLRTRAEPTVAPLDALRADSSFRAAVEALTLSDTAFDALAGRRADEAWSAVAVLVDNPFVVLPGPTRAVIEVLATKPAAQPQLQAVVDTHRGSAYRSWQVDQWVIGRQLRQGRRELARSDIDHAFVLYGDAAPVWPPLIEWLRDLDGAAAKQQALACSVRHPVYGEACRVAAMTKAELRQQESQSRREADRISDDLRRRTEDKLESLFDRLKR